MTNDFKLICKLNIGTDIERNGTIQLQKTAEAYVC